MSHVDKMADDVITQIMLAVRLKQNPPNAGGPKFKPYIGVYVASHNLIPIIDRLCSLAASTVLGLRVSSLKQLEEALVKHYDVRLDVWQKPAPFDDRNFLTLTVGSLTAIIFDREN